MVVGYLSIVLQALAEGFTRIDPNFSKITNDANDNAVVLAEAVQTFMRIQGYDNAYEQCKTLTHGFAGQMTSREFMVLVEDKLRLHPDHMDHLHRTLGASGPGVYVGTFPEFHFNF